MHSNYSFADSGIKWEHNLCSCQMVLCAFQTVSKTSAVKIHNGKGLKGSSGDSRNWLPNCYPAVHTGHCAYCSTLYDYENRCICKLNHVLISQNVALPYRNFVKYLSVFILKSSQLLTLHVHVQ
jgi:hypothetical protein